MIITPVALKSIYRVIVFTKEDISIQPVLFDLYLSTKKKADHPLDKSSMVAYPKLEGDRLKL